MTQFFCFAHVRESWLLCKQVALHFNTQCRGSPQLPELQPSFDECRFLGEHMIEPKGQYPLDPNLCEPAVRRAKNLSTRSTVDFKTLEFEQLPHAPEVDSKVVLGAAVAARAAARTADRSRAVFDVQEFKIQGLKCRGLFLFLEVF